MRLRADLHTHTVYSDGHGTPLENVLAAEERGLETVALTDHGPASPEGLTDRSFRRLVAESKEAEKLCSVRVYVGVEANIVSMSGEIDATPAMLGESDIVLAAVHNPRLILANPRSTEELRRAIVHATIRCIESGEVHIIAHPVWILEQLRCHITAQEAEEIARAAADHNVGLELNARHLPKDFTLYQVAVRVGAPITFGSDAHAPEEVGRFKPLRKLVRRLGIEPHDVHPEELGIV
ncbi:PHP domain-containing protein [Methanopyrus sp.]